MSASVEVLRGLRVDRERELLAEVDASLEILVRVAGGVVGLEAAQLTLLHQ